MKKLLKKALIVDESSSHHGKRCDVLISDGRIAKISTEIDDQDAETIISDHLCVSPGFFDLHVKACDPGFEHKEDLNSVKHSAKKGGFTSICLSPNTLPVTDNKSQVHYIQSANEPNSVQLFPVGAVSEQLHGENICEMYDMHLKGAVAFTDEKKSIQNADLLRRALLYTKDFGGLVMNFPNDMSIAQNGKMNEGINSTHAGLKGIPALAEELMVARDLFIAQYCETPIHFSTITTKKSVDLIRKAKANHQPVTCDVAVHNLVYTDEKLLAFDSLYKVNPPLRTSEDVEALIEGINDGTIDAITSDHSPQNIENKACEFDHASFGISSLETTFSLLIQHVSNRIELARIIECLSNAGRKIVRVPTVTIEEGQRAELTYFDTHATTTFGRNTWKSKSMNNPEIDATLAGKILGVTFGS